MIEAAASSMASVDNENWWGGEGKGIEVTKLILGGGAGRNWSEFVRKTPWRNKAG
jgi:hypothetical protein